MDAECRCGQISRIKYDGVSPNGYGIYFLKCEPYNPVLDKRKVRIGDQIGLFLNASADKK